MASRPLEPNPNQQVWTGFEQFSQFRPGEYQYEDNWWIEGAIAYLALTPAWQGLEWAMQDAVGPDDPNFNPYDAANIAGYEAYAGQFVDVRNRREMEQIKERIQINENRRRLSQQELGLGGMLFLELFNPVNYVPLPFMKGAGIARGAAGGAAATAGVVGAEEMARLIFDPTATSEEAITNLAFGTAFGGLIGGGLGGVRGAMKARSDMELGRAFQIETAYRDELLRESAVSSGVVNVPIMGRVGASRLAPSGARTDFPDFTIRPTDGETGVASAFGLENQTRATLWGKLKASGTQAINDWADIFLGDFNTISSNNRRGKKTAQSIQLNADIEWRAPGLGVVQTIREAFAEMELEGSAGREVLGVNVTAATRSVAEAVSSKPRENGKMRYDTFRDEVFRAYARGIDRETNPHVAKAAGKVREYLARAEAEGKATGAIFTHAKHRELLSRKFDEAKEALARVAELETLPTRGAAAEVELAMWKRKQENLIEWLEFEFRTALAANEDLADILRRVDRADFDTRMTSVQNMVERDRRILQELDQTELGRSLSEKEAALYDDIAMRLEEYDRLRGEGADRQRQPGDVNGKAEYIDTVDSKFTEAVLFYLDDVRQVIDRLAEERGFVRNEPNYLPRFWRIDKVIEDEAGPQQLRAILRQWYAGNNKGRRSPEAIEERVNDTINTIIQQAEMGELQAFNPNAGASFLKHRRLDIPNSLVLDFIETDIEKVMRTYSDRFGIVNEVYRIFGEGDASSALDDVLIQAAREGGFADAAEGLAKMEQLRTDMERARDKLTGKVYQMEPGLMNQRRIASALSAYGVVTYLGGAMLSAIPETARMFMVHGFSRGFDGVAKYAFGQTDDFLKASDRIAKLTMQGMDSVASTTLNRFAEMGGPTGQAIGPLGKAGQKLTDFAGGPYFLANLLAPFTDITKRISSTFTHQFMLEDILKLADGTADEKTVTMLGSYGIDKAMADRIAMQPFEKSGDFYLPNAGEWRDRDAARVFLTAVAGMTKNIIPTAGLADVPEIAKGFVKGREYPLLRLPFQFMTYGFAGVNRVLLSSLQGRDRSSLAGMAALIGLGYVTASLKMKDGWWESLSAEERAVRAVDASGIGGIYSDLITTVETATLGTVGMRPLMGLDPYINNPDALDAAGQVSGPVGDAIANVARMMVDDSASNRDVANTVRRIMPGHSLFYLKDLWKGVADSFDGRSPQTIEKAEMAEMAEAP